MMEQRFLYLLLLIGGILGVFSALCIYVPYILFFSNIPNRVQEAFWILMAILGVTCLWLSSYIRRINRN
jgi:ABC-type antimicrobial peptide transport system permease subunit